MQLCSGALRFCTRHRQGRRRPPTGDKADPKDICSPESNILYRDDTTQHACYGQLLPAPVYERAHDYPLLQYGLSTGWRHRSMRLNGMIRNWDWYAEMSSSNTRLSCRRTRGWTLWHSSGRITARRTGFRRARLPATADYQEQSARRIAACPAERHVRLPRRRRRISPATLIRPPHSGVANRLPPLARPVAAHLPDNRPRHWRKPSTLSPTCLTNSRAPLSRASSVPDRRAADTTPTLSNHEAPSCHCRPPAAASICSGGRTPALSPWVQTILDKADKRDCRRRQTSGPMKPAAAANRILKKPGSGRRDYVSAKRPARKGIGYPHAGESGGALVV